MKILTTKLTYLDTLIKFNGKKYFDTWGRLMEIISRIQPYLNRKDKEFEPYLEFLKKIVSKIDPEFRIFETFLEEDREDKPYESSITKTKYGTKEQGFEVIKSEVYEQVANNIVVDCGILYSRSSMIRSDSQLFIQVLYITNFKNRSFGHYYLKNA